MSPDLSGRIVLLDQDGVLADFVTGFRQAWERFGLAPLVDTSTWTQWDLTHYLPTEHKHMIDVIMGQPGFFLNLPPMPGAVEAVLGMQEAGAEVFVCSTPVATSDWCTMEKIQWLRRHLGERISKRVFFTHDKTMVRGHYLIDDKPEIKGCVQPVWNHVVFDWPYNAHVKNKPRLHNWGQWREVLR